MLENTQKIYQLIIETEKKFNDEKTKLVKRRETLQKKIDSKVPFSSAAKKREARYEIEEIDSSLEELERDKKQAVLDLEVLPQLKKAHDEDSKTWESSNNKKIDKRELYPDNETDRDSYQDDERDFRSKNSVKWY